MTKKEAVHYFVESRLKSLPTNWVQLVLEHGEDKSFRTLPMWGWMWLMEWEDFDDFTKEHCVMMDRDSMKSHYFEKIGESDVHDETKATEWIEDNYDEEMDGEWAVLDKDGDPTNIYAYEVEGQLVIGVHGAGYNFYDFGVWDRLYDALGLKWHDEEEITNQA